MRRAGLLCAIGLTLLLALAYYLALGWLLWQAIRGLWCLLVGWGC